MINRPVFLIGFAAAGKTTIGRALAARLGASFVDLDDDIRRAAGASVAEVFAREGEAGFRARERAALTARTQGGFAIVATGGGAAADEENLQLMRGTGVVISLGVTLATSLRRAAADVGAERPLMRGSADAIAALFATRAPAYRRAHAVVGTDDRDPEAIAAEVADAIAHLGRLEPASLANSSLVALGARSYPVVVGAGGLSRIGRTVREAVPDASRIAIVSDANVGPLHGESVARSLAADGAKVSLHLVPPGEASKNGVRYLALCDELIAAGLDRTSAIVAVGGGVVGDLAGFVAATLFRGVPIIHVPTTLVAMVDSAIGGKTAIDTAAGKNLVGAFWQPAAVVVDPEVLATLPRRERQAGFGELVKYGLLDGETLYREIEAAASGWTEERWSAASDAIAHLIGRAAGIKTAIVSRDEREQTGERRLLNLGHTVGHALESASDGALLHGEAVGLGLVAAARVSVALGVAAVGLEARITHTLTSAGLPTDLDDRLDPSVVARVAVDKKRLGSDVAFVTVAAPGRCDAVALPLIRLGQILAAPP